MREFNQPHPIHPADCGCPRCVPRLLRGRHRLHIEHALLGLIFAASFAVAALAILPTN